ncbi:cupin domain protein, partial [Vibrio cholerae CP1037(10)]
MMSTHPSLWL